MFTALFISLQRFGCYSRDVAADLREVIHLLTYKLSLTFRFSNIGQLRAPFSR